jgi:hypothetical protein
MFLLNDISVESEEEQTVKNGSAAFSIPAMTWAEARSE